MTISSEAHESLTIMMAAYNEAENLAVLLPRINALVARLTPDYEILVVDTYTPMDDTRAICEQNGAVYLNRENSNNYGDAIRTGIRHSQGEVRGQYGFGWFARPCLHRKIVADT